jgi:hypothetical protein
MARPDRVAPQPLQPGTAADAPGDEGLVAPQVACPTCGSRALAWGDAVLLGGTAIVSLQRYRCERAAFHLWDDTRVLVDDVSPNPGWPAASCSGAALGEGPARWHPMIGR